MPEKIINSFQQRRQLAQEIADLAETANEADLLEAVRGLAHRYPADLLVTAVVRNLDTSSSQIRGGLGHLAALLPPEEIGPALRSAAANRQHNAQTRVTAALLLERFLGEAVSPGLLGDLNQTNEVALQSLREAVDEGHRNRHVFVEYVTQMRQAGGPVAYMVMDLMERIAPADRVGILRLLAQEEQPGVARAALQRLEQLATVDHVPAALRALHTLQTTLPPEPAAQVGRALRKLAFAGTRYTPPSPARWRALISPADMGGSYSIWFVGMPGPGDRDGVLLGLVVNARAGILQVFASETMEPDQLPKAHAVGELVSVRTDNGGTAVLLEASFDDCRWRLLAAHEKHWHGKDPRPLPDDYKLYQDRLWEFEAPRPNPALAAYLVEDVEAPLPDPEALAQAAADLLAHPAMAGWVLHNRLLLQAFSAETLARLPVLELTAHVVRALEQQAEHVQLTGALAEGLRAQAVWLHIAGDVESAQRAHLLANAQSRLPLAQNPLVVRLVEASLHAAGLRGERGSG